MKRLLIFLLLILTTSLFCQEWQPTTLNDGLNEIESQYAFFDGSITVFYFIKRPAELLIYNFKIVDEERFIFNIYYNNNAIENKTENEAVFTFEIEGIEETIHGIQYPGDEDIYLDVENSEILRLYLQEQKTLVLKTVLAGNKLKAKFVIKESNLSE